MQRKGSQVDVQQTSSGDPVTPSYPPPTGMELNSEGTAAPRLIIGTGLPNSRVVVLVNNETGTRKIVAASMPVYHVEGESWQPNRQGIEAKYPWLTRMIGIEALIRLALDIVSL